MHDQHIILPNVQEGARIGLLGGSFDPPHLSHQLLALSFLALEPLDELWIIPCGSHAFKNELSPFHHRFSMCEKAFGRIKNIRIMPIENELKAPSFTIETLKIIHNLRPDLKLLLCIGSDILSEFHKWKDPTEIIKLAPIVIFERMDFPITVLPSLLKDAHVHKGYALPPLASSSLRKALINNHKEKIKPLIDREVLRYIEEHKLYI